jgi:hypothetical protein
VPLAWIVENVKEIITIAWDSGEEQEIVFGFHPDYGALPEGWAVGT